MQNRRRFVELTTVTGAAAFLGGPLGAAPARRAAGAPPTGTRGRFHSRLGEPFVADDGRGGRVWLVLVEVSDPGAVGAPRSHPECFSASFLGPAGRLRQGTYIVSNAGLGRRALFLVPVGRPRDGVQHYEAAFNRAVPS